MAHRHMEDDFQMQVADYLRLQYPQLLFYHVPNGGRRNAREGARLKRMGVRPGAPDIEMHWVGGKAAIELKIGKNDQTPSQKLFQHQWLHTGGQYAICRCLDDVIIVLKEWRVPGITSCPSAYAQGAIMDKYTAKKRGIK